MVFKITSDIFLKSLYGFSEEAKNDYRSCINVIKDSEVILQKHKEIENCFIYIYSHIDCNENIDNISSSLELTQESIYKTLRLINELKVEHSELKSSNNELHLLLKRFITKSKEVNQLLTIYLDFLSWWYEHRLDENFVEKLKIKLDKFDDKISECNSNLSRIVVKMESVRRDKYNIYKRVRYISN